MKLLYLLPIIILGSPGQGDQIGQFLNNKATFCRVIDEIAKKMAVPWATKLLYFHLNNLFKNMFCILELFGLAAVWAKFEQIG